MILAIDTAGDVCAVALADGHRLVFEAALHVPRAHAAHLAPMIAATLERAGVGAADLRAVAVSAGPGSYTGLRIGVSTAKGLCFAHGASLVAVPTLAALAYGARPWMQDETRVLAALPSRRGEVYAASVDLAGLEPRGAGSYALDAFPTDLAGADPVMVVGPAAGAVAEALARAGRRDVRAIELSPSAAGVAAIGARRLDAGLTEDVVSFEPDYVTPAYVGVMSVNSGPQKGAVGGEQ